MGQLWGGAVALSRGSANPLPAAAEDATSSGMKSICTIIGCIITC
ncbi:hypothetical protein [Cereibacter sphaeroides]|nr:hypothetical protein [Cereibacter sphaeroides]